MSIHVYVWLCIENEEEVSVEEEETAPPTETPIVGNCERSSSLKFHSRCVMQGSSYYDSLHQAPVR